MFANLVLQNQGLTPLSTPLPPFSPTHSPACLRGVYVQREAENRAENERLSAAYYAKAAGRVRLLGQAFLFS